MPYQVQFTDPAHVPQFITVPDQDVNQETSLTFVGKNYTGYATSIAENFLHLLENFARNVAPSNPIVGQLWYDIGTLTNPPTPQLKIWDGTNWARAGNIIKSPSSPTVGGTISFTIGDLWVNTTSQQLSLWSGSSWILVGPQFSAGTQTGPTVDTIVDTLNISHSVIKLVVSDQIVAIVSRDSFTPKATIEGFSTIQQGINISAKDFDGDGVVLNKLWGTAEKASALLIGNATVSANNFLRSDVASVTNYGLSIRSNAGLTVGTDQSTILSNQSNGIAILSNKIDGSSIIIRTRQSNADKDVLTVTGNFVGINNTAPGQALDVTGKIRTNDAILITGTTETTNLTSGSLQTLGGAAITKNLRVGGNLNVIGTAATGALTVTGGINSTGTITANSVTASSFNGTFIGQLTGTVLGSASTLTSPTVFSLTGDVSSNAISFTGQQVGGLATFTTTLSQDFINNKTAVTTVAGTDEFILNRPGTGLRKTTKSSFLSGVPIVPTGAIFPFAGTSAPSGYLLCDGSEQLISLYPDLFSVIGYTYKSIGLLQGTSTFALPDLRGRFPLGRDNMNNGTLVPLSNPISTTGLVGSIAGSGPWTGTITGLTDTFGLTPGVQFTATAGTGSIGTGGIYVVNTSSTTSITFTATGGTTPTAGTISNITVSSALGSTITASADRVTDVTADTVGLANGAESRTLSVSNLPDHKHDLKSTDISGNKSNQFYAIRNVSGAITDIDVVPHTSNGPDAAGTAQYLTNSGGIETVGSLGNPINQMNPYLTLNYIIKT